MFTIQPKKTKLQRRTIIRHLGLISVALCHCKLEANIIKICKDSIKWLPNVDLNHLPEDQSVSLQKLLTEEFDAFSKPDYNMENIESLKLKLNVTDPIPICKPYHKIHTHIFWSVSIFWGCIDQRITCFVSEKRWNYEVCIITERWIKFIQIACQYHKFRTFLTVLVDIDISVDMSRENHQGYMDRDFHSVYNSLGFIWVVKDTFYTFQCTPGFPKIYELMFIGIKGQCIYTILG